MVEGAKYGTMGMVWRGACVCLVVVGLLCLRCVTQFRWKRSVVWYFPCLSFLCIVRISLHPHPHPCLQASVADAASSTGRVRGRGGMAAGIASPKASTGPILASAAPPAPVGGGGSSSGQDAVKEADGAAAGAEDGMGDGEVEEVS